MLVNFEAMNVRNFKSHEEINAAFGAITRVSGRNGIGKSSLGECATWLLFGVDMMGGSKFDPTPLTAEADTITEIELLLSVEREGQAPIKILLKKQLVKGKAKYFVNDVPEKAGKFDEVVSELFDKNLFLSCFNPVYFFSQHWKEQREQLLKYVSEPFETEVLEAMPTKTKAEALKAVLNNKTVEDIEKIYKPKYTEADRQHERAVERWLTLKEQLEQAQGTTETIDEAAIDEEIQMLEEQLGKSKETNTEALKIQRERSQLEYELGDYVKRINKIKDDIINLQGQEIAETCHTCGQDLNQGAINIVKENRTAQLQELKGEGRALTEEYKVKKANYDNMQQPGNMIDTGAAQSRLYELKNLLETKDRLKPLAAQVKEAEANKEKLKSERLEAMGLLEAVKEFNTTKSELMVIKVGGLFKNLSVKLEDEAKNGSVKPCFEVEWSGKPYSKLSTAERIKAGLEVVNVLAAESGVIVPVFVDNAESIITFSKPLGQLITATVKNSHLVIKIEGAE